MMIGKVISSGTSISVRSSRLGYLMKASRVVVGEWGTALLSLDLSTIKGSKPLEIKGGDVGKRTISRKFYYVAKGNFQNDFLYSISNVTFKICTRTSEVFIIV